MRLKKIYLVSALAAGMIILLHDLLYNELLNVFTPGAYQVSSENNLRYSAKEFPTRNEPASLNSNLIILTYRRSGSSLTGDIIQANSAVFYVFEPFCDLESQLERSGKQRMVHYRDNKSISISSSEEVFSLYINTMKAIFNCRFEDLDNVTLKQSHMGLSRTTSSAFQCIWKNRTARTELQWPQLLRCHQTSTDNCRAAKLKVVKTIRLGMEHAEALMGLDPNLKIIHLIRDPRGILNSRLDLNLTGELIEYNHLCGQVMDDIQRSKQLSRSHPGRILTVRYEDIAESPIAAAKQIYAFVGLEMDSKIEEFIWNHTYAGLWKGYKYGTKRNNSAVTATAWRTMLDYQRMLDVQNSCSGLLSLMGYRLFYSKEDVRNFTLSQKYRFYDPDLKKISI